MSGAETDDLSGLLDAVAEKPAAWEFFALVRGVEQLRADLPRVGKAVDPAREAIDLAHEPSADFPAATVVNFVRHRSPRPSARASFLGLTGPMGPLPMHLTELAIYERNQRRPSPFSDFLDLLSARMLQAFYRAWGDANPCAQADRSRDDHFASMIGALTGAADLRFVDGAGRLPAGGARGFDAWNRLAYGGHLSALRSASALTDLLSRVLARPVKVMEAVGRWRVIQEDQRSRLGIRLGSQNRLGLGATLGGRFYAVEWDVALSVDARSMDDLAEFLPGQRINSLLLEAIRFALPAHLDWRAAVVIDERQITPARLNGARLGQTGWLAPGGRPCARTDLKLGPRSRGQDVREQAA